MSEEVFSQKVQVSAEVETTGGEAAPSTDVAQDTPVSQKPKKRTRGIDLSQLTPEQLRLHKKNINDKAQKNRRDKKKASSFVYDSGTEPTKAEAKEILTARGIQNEHVLDLFYRLALIAASQNNVPANRFLFQNGIRKMLASYEAQAPQTVETIPAEEVAGELLNRAELFAHYDYGFWRHPEVTFDQWLADRLQFKMSAFGLSKILGKEDFGAKHEEWTDFAPRWNPIGLRPNYTQKQALTWLDAQSTTKRYLLVASRNSMKSTWARILALTLTITYPDARILIVSETNKLSKKAMKEFRSYLEMAPNNPTLFQQYFAEFTIAPDEGQSLIYDNPLARLGLPQNSVESSSMESSNTGSRFDFCLFDDPISRDNGTSNEDQRAEAIAKHGSIMKLREPAGYALNVQTPWVSGDLGDVMIKRNDEDPEKPLAVRVDPVMDIKPEAGRKNLLSLTQDDVVLNFLPKLNWKFVRDEMRSPEGIEFFKTQYLTQWPSADDEGLRVTFTEDDLRAHLRRREFFREPAGTVTVGFLDRAYQTHQFADYSALGAAKIMPVTAREGALSKLSFVVWDMKVERLKESELVKAVVDMWSQNNVTRFVMQKDRGKDENFELALRKHAMLRSVTVPYIRWVSTTDGTQAPLQKARRIKKLEEPLSRDALWFRTGEWNDLVFSMFTKMDGGIFVSSNSVRKLDAPDAISLGYEQFMPRTLTEPEPDKDAAVREQEEREEWEREQRRQFHERIINGGQPVDRSIKHSEWQRQQRGEPQVPTQPDPPPAGPRVFPRGGSFATLPAAFRTRTR
jgi:hypothetical protein